MENLVSALALLGLSIFTSVQATISGDLLHGQSDVIFQKQTLSSESLDLSTRYPDTWVNEVFSDNILLNLHYFHASLGEAGKVGRSSKMEEWASLKGDVENLKDEKGNIDWEKVRAPFDFSLALEPGQTFAYHRNLLPEFKDKKALPASRQVLIGESRFWYDEGYKSDGYLVADGVCHLASLFNWVASEAGLNVLAKVNHDFLPVPGVPQEFGTSIFYAPDGGQNSADQNLYITNNFSYPVEFEISADGEKIGITITAKTE